MSDLGNVYNSPIITAINGLVTDDSVVDVSIAAQTAFSQIEDTIGNLHGVSDVNEEPSRLINTIAGVLGALADESNRVEKLPHNEYLLIHFRPILHQNHLCLICSLFR